MFHRPRKTFLTLKRVGTYSGRTAIVILCSSSRTCI